MNPHPWLYFVVNPSARIPKFPWPQGTQPTRRMLMLFLVDYLELIAQRKRRARPFKMAGLYALVGVGTLNIGVSMAESNWPWMLLHMASTTLLVWFGLVRKPNQRMILDRDIAEIKRGAEDVRAMVKTRAATWLDEPINGEEEL